MASNVVRRMVRRVASRLASSTVSVPRHNQRINVRSFMYYQSSKQRAEVHILGAVVSDEARVEPRLDAKAAGSIPVASTDKKG